MTKTWGAGATALRAIETVVRAGVRLAREGLGGLFSSVLGTQETRLSSAAETAPSPAPPTGRRGSPPATPPGGPSSPAETPAPRPPSAPAPLGPVWVSPQNRAVLLARDPHSLFVHWEIHPVRRVETLRAMGADGETACEILRVFEIDTMPPFWQDVEIDPGAERAYASVDPERAYRVEVGLRTASGRFVALAMSNTVTTPPATPSADTAVHWVVLEEGQPREVAPPASWTGQRLAPASTATALDEPPESDVAFEGPSEVATAPVGSSEQLPPGPPPRPRPPAVPARPRASDALPLR